MRRRDLLLAASALGLTRCATVGRLPEPTQPDVKLVAEALSLHPGLGRYLTAAEIGDGLSRLDAEWRNPDRAARFLALSRFLSTLRCGHTFCNPVNQKQQVREELFDRDRALPFTFVWLDGTPVVTKDQGGGIPPGTRVTSIEGLPSREVLSRLLPYTRADGRGDAKRLAQLGVQGTDRFETFDLFHALVMPGPRGGRLKLEVVSPDGLSRSLEVLPLTHAQRSAFRRDSDLPDDAPRWDWSIDSEGIALLRMPTWALYDTKWNWQRWLTDRLDSLKGARGLIIDLRENEGGLDCGNMILARLATGDLELQRYVRRVRFRTTPAALDPILDTWDDSFRKLGVDAKDVGGGFFELPREDGVERIAAVGPRLTLKTAVLIGPVNSSATFQFAWRCREAGLARLIGQPTGGNLRGINGGAFFFVRLPESGLEFDLPLIGTFAPTAQPDAGLEPDVLVNQTAETIAAGRDVALEAARTYVRA